MGNTFGKIFRLTTFGESHGEAIGGVIDGFPSGLDIDTAFIQSELDRRKPGQNKLTTGRKEDDRVEILSGIFEGKSTGSPIGFIVRNKGQRPGDYDEMKDLFRPSHADYTYFKRYGIRDYRGGGRASARATVSWCVGGAFAKLALKQLGIYITAYTSQVGSIKLDDDYRRYDLKSIESNSVRCPDAGKAEDMERLIAEVKAEGDSVGGVVTCIVKGCPPGIGEPEAGKLSAELGGAMLSINAAKAIELGMGFKLAEMKGSEANDPFVNEAGEIHTCTNHSGGLLGGISDGEDIYFRVAFKPVATIAKEQNTVDKEGNALTLKAKGRHDPCVVPRAVPIVEAMAAMTIFDQYLRFKASVL